MIRFNECRITSDGRHLIVDVSVIESEYFNDVFIDSISIDTDKTYVDDGPSDKSVLSLTSNDIERFNDEIDNAVYPDDFYTIQSEGSKHLRLVVHKNDPRWKVDMNKEMLFVYVHTTGSPKSDAPCDISQTTQMKSVVNMFPLYKKAMEYIHQIESDCCEMPYGFQDMMIKIKAFEVAIKTGNYTRAIKYWNKYLNGIEDNIVKHKCGCHGR